MEGQTCIVTGASSGIGKVTARELARRGAQVVLVCRDRGRGGAALEEIRAAVPAARLELVVCNLASQQDIRRAAAEFLDSHERLDVLVNNAGAILGSRRLTEDGIEETFAVNHLGYFLLARELGPVLERSAPARVVSVASEAHRSGRIDFDRLQSDSGMGGWRAYCESKLANVLFASELARRLDGTGVTSNSLHPGAVATRFGNSATLPSRLLVLVTRPFMIGPEKGARTSIYLASSPDVEGVTGLYFSDCAPARPSKAAQDLELAARLWAVSEQLTGLA